jgi:hypothetical protein
VCQPPWGIPCLLVTAGADDQANSLLISKVSTSHAWPTLPSKKKERNDWRYVCVINYP